MNLCLEWENTGLILWLFNKPQLQFYPNRYHLITELEKSYITCGIDMSIK